MSRKTAALITLFVVALGLRVVAVQLLGGPIGRPQTYEHGEIARNLLAGRGFTVMYLGVEGPTSQQAPWAPFLLAGAYAIAGVDTPAAILLVQLLQCVAGSLLVLTVVWLAWLLVPDRPAVGWIAGCGAAVYPPHIYMVTHVQVVTWASLAITLLLAIALSTTSANWRRSALLAGLVGGWLLMIEPILALALPVAAIVVGCAVLRGKTCARSAGLASSRLGKDSNFKLRPAFAAMTLMTVTTLAMAMPWLVRNYRVHGELVFVKSSFGYAFWQGNHPLSWGTDKIPKPSVEEARRNHNGTLAERNAAMWEARHETLYIDDVLLKPYGYARFQGLSEPERSRVLGREASAAIAADPARYAYLCLKRLKYFLLFDETNPKASDTIYRVSTLSWLTLSVAGLVMGRRRWRAWWPTFAVFLVVMGFHVLTIVSARFRIPLEPLSFVWCATAVEAIALPLVAWLGVAPRQLVSQARCFLATSRTAR